MSISFRTNSDGSNGAIQLNGTDRIVMTSGGTVNVNNGTLVCSDSFGNVGIGTSSPTQKLDVNGTVRVQNEMYIRNALFVGDTTSSGTSGCLRATTWDGLVYIQAGQNNSMGSSAPLVFTNINATSEYMRLVSGKLMVGTSTNSFQNGTALVLRTSGPNWSVGPSSDNPNNFYVMQNGNSGVYLGNGQNGWTSWSDERLKDIVEPISDAVQKVSTLRSVIGKYKTDEDGVRRSFLIAQDLQNVLPEAVESSDPNRLGVQYTAVIPLLVAAIKELKTELDATKAEVAALKEAK